MKQKYDTPLMEIDRFESEDIASIVDISEKNYIPDTATADDFDD